jgi:6-pyruvoyltetrahydropterin/6-carboxytetrahydropterin synthase
MKYQITKTLTFEAAHRLLKNYSGKCTNNHGHSWVIVLTIEAETLDNRDMVIDFAETKALKTWIDDNLDHTTILWKNDPMCDYIQQTGQRIFITENSPTSEHIAEIILNKANELFNSDRTRVYSIEVSETCTSSVRLIN